jgi:hypothetical protein
VEITAFLGHVFQEVGMICLDMEGGLTNDPVHGIRANAGGLGDSRRCYKESWSDWQEKNIPRTSPFLPFPLDRRRYLTAPEMIVSYADQQAVLADFCDSRTAL